jgi:enoyl-CoA hydratase
MVASFAMTVHLSDRDPDGIVILRVDRPEVRNALDQATMQAFTAAIAEVSKDIACRALVITGSTDAFISGGDLAELRNKTTLQDAEELANAGTALCDALEALPLPVIAAIDGPAIGGGAEIAIACDIRIMGATGRICFRHVRLGVTTAWGTLPRLQAIAPSAITSLLLSAASVSARDAPALGLSERFVDNVPALDRALQFARESSKAPSSALAATKQNLVALRQNATLRAQERSSFLKSWVSSDHIKAVEAFFQK